MYLLTEVEERSLGDGLGASVGSQLQHGLVAEAQTDAGDEGTGRPSGRLGHIVQVDDAYLGGETRGGKRGRGAQGKTPFVAAVQVTEEGVRWRCGSASCVKGFRKQEIAAWAHRHLRRETVVYSDGLACFRGVEEAGCEHRPRVTGGGPGSCEAPGLGWVNTVLGNVKRALDGTYHAWGQKYAPRYLAEFSYRFKWPPLPTR